MSDTGDEQDLISDDRRVLTAEDANICTIKAQGKPIEIATFVFATRFSEKGFLFEAEQK